MSSTTPKRLSKVLGELNISYARAKEFLESKDIPVDNPNAKITEEAYQLLLGKFSQDLNQKQKAESKIQQIKEDKEAMRSDREASLQKSSNETPTDKVKIEAPKIEGPKILTKIELSKPKKQTKEQTKEQTKADSENKESLTETNKTLEPKNVTDDPLKNIEIVSENIEETKDKLINKTPDLKTENAEAETPIEAAKIGLNIKGKINLENLSKKQVGKKQPIDLPQNDTDAQILQETESISSKQKAKTEEKKEVDNKILKEEIPTNQQEDQRNEKSLEIKVKDEHPSTVSTSKIETKFEKLEGVKFTGEVIDLSKFEKKKEKDKDKDHNKHRKVIASSPQGQIIDKEDKKGKKRKRISKEKTAGDNTTNTTTGTTKTQSDQKRFDKSFDKKNKHQKPVKKEVDPVELSDEEISKQIKETLEKLTSNKKSKLQKIKKLKRDERREALALSELQAEEDSKTLKVTEFVTVGEVANMMNVPVTKVIATCMSLGLMVTMNQRLDAETLTIVADEFGYKVEFVDAEVATDELVEEEEDKEEDLVKRPPIVTVMGHVDHGKTSLLDYIRNTNVIAGEAGGITQHIGAYSVELPDGQHITFLDTPGHEAFTAMRARGAKITDVAIIVIAADDNVMPQTKEAISHAQAAGVPLVFAINKIDKPNANPDKIKEQLANMNLLVEDWGGKIQSQEISAKTGVGIQELLEKVLLEAELLDLKANPNKRASGTVIEASLDKGRGYVSTILVQNGTLKVGDIVLAGQYAGKVRALLDERGKPIKSAGPSTPAAMLGLDGAPAAGDKFVVMKDEKEAKQLANKRQQLQREQAARAHKKITLEEIGRRLALGDFKELNIILKCDVDGSVEALSDALSKLSTEKIQVRILHKGVGQITESDVLLASASDAIIVGFNVRPSANARKIAEREQVEIRHYSIIYDAIDEIKSAMEGMLAPETKEVIIANVEVRETFKISKVGTIAGCMVLDGTIKRGCKVRVIRDGVVIYTGELASLKRFKDDVKEVSKGYECGLMIKNFNDIKVADIIEAYEETLVKQKI
ncbi:translation initiation factor IF-2 [Schleiferia thermophila]|jgi:translation initiation factor IF-2|uniref:Translation initiation factor IF-2 n=1 Tax=Schleiferia thermophila TaxID=884107 RepID=A0A369A3U2_9FLAO|nr:translation initiation factor IF-2 [Schleiferia thermophila]KFD39663.1 translation initiation factor IF-2 [Schleiferia thermophila str. Yellowstone]PMB13340.1 translation initiation factor IF-2 [Fischerella thermalis CCMEE 5319]RCX03831.1 translation initiation factor IF-2 [Schleiferia thermophila]GCD80063.1 translation initiation factor IF-2 [Schleiferia thermophila]